MWDRADNKGGSIGKTMTGEYFRGNEVIAGDSRKGN